MTVSTPPGWLLMYDGSLTYPGPINENDVWASADLGKTWDLIGGVSRFGSGGFQNAHIYQQSFSGRSASSQCEDPTNDDVFSLGGVLPNEGASNQVWMSTDAISWVLQTGRNSFTPGRSWTSCDIDDHGLMYVMGGLVPGATAAQNRLLNDIWWGSNQGRTWQRADDPDSEAQHWSPRAEHLVLQHHSALLKVDLIYVMGGWTLYQPPRQQTTNDVWVTSDGGVTWVELTGKYNEDAEPSGRVWSPRWGHTGVITEKGVMLVIGGADSRTGLAGDQLSTKDVWASFDGGVNWHACRLPPNPDWLRTEQSAQLSVDEHLVLASGYLFSNGSRRIDFSDVWLSNISMSDPAAVAAVCGGEEALPTKGVGLRVWPGSDVAPIVPARALSGVAIAAIVFAILIAVALAGYCVSGYKKYGFWPVPVFLGGRSTVVLDTMGGESGSTSTDYSAFSFGGEKADAATTNGNGTNGTSAEHENTQYLS